jgi:opacity protein-like surface antigen
MRARLTVSLVALVVVALAPTALGQTSAGMIETNGSFSFAALVGQNTPDNSAFALSGQVGYYVEDAISIGGRLTWVSTTTGDLTVGGWILLGIADFPLASASGVVPYLGGGIGFEHASVKYGSQSADDTKAVVEFHGGAKMFFRENAAVTLEGRYYTYLDNFADIAQFSVVGGLSFYFF